MYYSSRFTRGIYDVPEVLFDYAIRFQGLTPSCIGLAHVASFSCNNCSPPGTGIYARSEITFVDVNRLQAHIARSRCAFFSFDHSPCAMPFRSIVHRQVPSSMFFFFPMASMSKALHNLRLFQVG